MTRIADSIDGVLAMTENIEATYKPSRRAFVAYTILALLIAIFWPVMYVLNPSDKPAPAGLAFFGVLFVGSVFMAGATFVTRCSTYTVSSAGFAQESPIGIGSWHLRPYDVASADLKIGKLHWVLVLRSVERKTRRIPLYSSMEDRFAERFPFMRS